MTPEIPTKLPAKGIALLFGVTEQRISQLKRKGRLSADEDGNFDVRSAMAMRDFQMNEHGVRMVAQLYSNGTGKVSPPKISPITLTDEERDVLGINLGDVAASPNSVVAQANRVTDLRARKLESEARRAEMREQRERGELIRRADVQTSAQEAGALIASILQNLPAEIAAIFADPDKKSEVRAKVQQRIDQMQHALATALRDKTDGGAD